MVIQKVVMKNQMGLHMRPAKQICDTAVEFSSKISLVIGDKTVNAKSVLGVLSACIRYNDEFEIMCEGADEEKALEAMVKIASAD